ncbi:hypothetical protein CBR_g50791 [Chara braunii]|uniref:Reverse transcriptase RNase H-like domain-containing protein n=1 Tax=Chara braunii TaxID=69332 RepID=A0A388K5X7_CHABU|nr:hypothetical protein CBR_g50791 [Chara braunii]|eukprot:GBG65431.1 hypothetical protein CBR_g50791 [Chara braunii]
MGECYAALWGISHFRAYLYGQKFKLVTDHEPLLALKKSNDFLGMIRHWATTLQSMDFDIRHQKHEKHGNVDKLTRLDRPDRVPKSEEVTSWRDPESKDEPQYGNWKRRPTKMPEGGSISDGAGRVMTLEDLIATLDRHEKTPSNVPKVETFLFDGKRVSDWLDLVEQAMVGLSDEVKFQRIMRYVLHRHHQEVQKVVDAAHGSWARFKESMLRKYRLGDGVLTISDLEGMNKDDFTTIGAFVQQFKKKARKVHGISEERQCAIFQGLLTGSEAAELTSRRGGAYLSTSSGEKRSRDGASTNNKPTFFRRRVKQGAQRRYKTIDKKCRPVLVLVTEDEEAYYERERGLIRRMQEQALKDPCRINDGNEEKLIVGEPYFLSPQERALMVRLMKKRHGAYAFNDDQRGRLDVDKIPMIRIHTVPHEPWNVRGARYPNPDEEKMVVDYLDGKMRTHVADYSSDPYASPWFCFIKPNGTLRWVQDLQRLNAVTVRDARGLPNADALSESCAGRPIISLIDLYSRSDFLKAAMQRGGRGQRPLGASGGEERHGPFRREPTPVFDDDNIELFLDAYREHAAQRGWDVSKRALLIWTRGAERPLARKIQGRARDWEDCRAQLKVAFRRPEPERPEPRVDRRRRSKRLRDLEARELVTSRGGQKALAQREGGQAGPTRARESFPACGLRQVELHPDTEGDLPVSSLQAPEQRESEVPAAPFRGLEAHLDASQWEASSAGVSPMDPSGGERIRPEPEAEPLRLKGVGAEDIIMVEGDTPPDSPARAQTRRSWPEGVPEPDNQEAPVPPPEAAMSPRQEIEARGPGEGWGTKPRLVIDSRLAVHAAEHPDIEGPSLVGPSSGPARAELEGGLQAATGEVTEAGTGKKPDEATQANRARVRARLEEIHERRDRMKAAGIAPTPPVDLKTSERRIDELWARYEGRREAARQKAQGTGQATKGADEAIEVGELGFSATREAIKWVDKEIKQTSITAFHRYSLLSDELALRKDEVEQLTAQLAEERAENKAWQTRLEAKEAEYDIQGKGVQGLFGQEEAAGASRQEKLGKVFLDPAEAEARKEANNGRFEFKAPTELASQPEAPTSADAPTEALTQEPQPAPVEEGAAEESLAILLDVQEGTLAGAMEPPQLEVQEEEPSRLDELVAVMEVDMRPEEPRE